MYSEKTFKNYIFWIQVKRVVLIILFCCIGAGAGIGIGAILKGTLQIDSYNNIIIAGLTIIFFLFSLVMTSGTGKEVQDGYWKIAVLRKLTAIQKTLEANLAQDDRMRNDAMKKINQDILEETQELQVLKSEKPVKQKKVKKTKVKTLKVPKS